MSESSKEIIITGANGLVGFEVLKLFASTWQGHRIKAFVRQEPKTRLNGVTYIFGDLPGKIPKNLFEADEIILIHCASLLKADSLQAYREVNVQGTKSLIELAGPKLKFVIYNSSMSVYGQGPFRGITEDTPLIPETDLARSRLEAEEVIRKYSDREATCFILRPRFLFGERDKETLPGLLKLSRGKMKIGNGNQSFSYIGVDDYALIIDNLVRHQRNEKMKEALNIGYLHPLSYNEIMNKLGGKGFKVTLPVKLLIKLPLGKLRTKLELIGQDQIMDCSKLMKLYPQLKNIDGKKKFEQIVKDLKEKTGEA